MKGARITAIGLVVGAVAWRAMAVNPPIITRQQPVKGVQDVLLRSGAQLHHDHACGGVRHEHVEQPIATV